MADELVSKIRQSVSRLVRSVSKVFSRITYYGAYKDAMDRLEQRSALEELGFITAAIEHDLRSPMAALDTLIEIMKERFQHERELGRSLEQLQFHLERMHLSLSLISLFRGDAEYFQSFMRKINVVDLINGAIKNLKREVAVSDTISFRLDGKSVFVRAEPRMLFQAVSSLLKNSIEAVQEAKRDRGLIALNLKRTSGMLLLEISDNGCGIPEDDIPRLGSLFTSKKYGGANRGLGLFTVARIVDVHDGSIKISSEYGKGTTVSMSLPLWKDR